MNLRCINSANYGMILEGEDYHIKEVKTKKLIDGVEGYWKLIGKEMPHYLLSDYNNDHWYPHFLFRRSLPLNTKTKVL